MIHLMLYIWLLVRDVHFSMMVKQHKSLVKDLTCIKENVLLCEYFTKKIYKWVKYYVQIIEKMEGNGRTKRWAMDISFSQMRTAKQTE